MSAIRGRSPTPRQAPTPRQSATPFLAEEPQGFGDVVYRQLRSAPWVLCSVGVHGFVGLLLLLYPWQTADAAERPQMISMRDADPAPELVEEEPPDVPETDIVEEKHEPEEVSFKDAKDDHSETDVDQPTEETFGELDNLSNAMLDGPMDNGTIGLLGNAGGPRGNGLGGSRNLKGGGASRRTETTVDLALEWLKNHQSPDGRWSCDGFSDHCKLNKCDGPGEAAYTPGVSGLAMLCFLGHGETHQHGPYKDVVKRGLKYLKSIQDSEGCFGPRTSQHFQYNHACAALAMTEAYGMTNSRLFKESAQRGVNFTHQSQNPYLAWRYGVRDGDNDTSVTGWQTMVLKSAVMAELDVDKTAFKGAIAWVDKMTEPEFGRVGYQQRGGQPARTAEMQDRFPADQSEALTSVGVLTRIFAGQDPEKHEAAVKGLDLIGAKPPVWDLDSGEIDMYSWYYGTLVMFQAGGARWQRWNTALKTAVIDQQRTESNRDERGSWDPVGPWAPEGGRVYSTALLCLCMEVYYRYPRVMGTR